MGGINNTSSSVEVSNLITIEGAGHTVNNPAGVRYGNLADFVCVSTLANDVRMPMNKAGTFKNFKIRLTNTSGIMGYKIILFKNDVPTNLLVTINAGDGIYSNTTDEVTVNVNDLVYWKFEAGTGTDSRLTGGSIEFLPS